MYSRIRLTDLLVLAHYTCVDRPTYYLLTTYLLPTYYLLAVLTLRVCWKESEITLIVPPIETRRTRYEAKVRGRVRGIVYSDPEARVACSS